jgi:carbohydrate-binding DOMON domain-containing protein
MHDVAIKEISSQLKPILDHSAQGVYVYLDDEHKVCNEKFASLLGYNSPEEWAAVTESFPVAFVADESQHTLVSAYQDAMQDMVGSAITITWKKKDGELVESTVILVPLSFKGHVCAMHFIDV